MTGKEIAEVRSIFEMSQSQFGSLLDASWNTVSRWEHDKSMPTAFQMAVLEILKKVSVNFPDAGMRAIEIMFQKGAICALHFLLSKGIGENNV